MNLLLLRCMLESVSRSDIISENSLTIDSYEGDVQECVTTIIRLPKLNVDKTPFLFYLDSVTRLRLWMLSWVTGFQIYRTSITRVSLEKELSFLFLIPFFEIIYRLGCWRCCKCLRHKPWHGTSKLFPLLHLFNYLIRTQNGNSLNDNSPSNTYTLAMIFSLYV